MSGFANEAYIVVTLNLLSLELICNNPEKQTVMYESFGGAAPDYIKFRWIFLMLLIAVVPVMSAGGQRRRRGSLARFRRPSDPDER